MFQSRRLHLSTQEMGVQLSSNIAYVPKDIMVFRAKYVIYIKLFKAILTQGSSICASA